LTLQAFPPSILHPFQLGCLLMNGNLVHLYFLSQFESLHCPRVIPLKLQSFYQGIDFNLHVVEVVRSGVGAKEQLG
jgi:hypothetical protein